MLLTECISSHSDEFEGNKAGTNDDSDKQLATNPKLEILISRSGRVNAS